MKNQIYVCRTKSEPIEFLLQTPKETHTHRFSQQDANTALNDWLSSTVKVVLRDYPKSSFVNEVPGENIFHPFCSRNRDDYQPLSEQEMGSLNEMLR